MVRCHACGRFAQVKVGDIQCCSPNCEPKIGSQWQDVSSLFCIEIVEKVQAVNSPTPVFAYRYLSGVQRNLYTHTKNDLYRTCRRVTDPRMLTMKE